MENENKIINLFTDGEVMTKENRKFTRMVGAFGNNNPMFTIWQAGELLGLSTKAIKENFDNNTKNFENEVDFVDLKSALDKNDSENIVDITGFLKQNGYSQNKLNATKNWLTFSLSGMMKLVKIATTKEAWNIYDSFLEDYFKTKTENIIMKNTLDEELEFLKKEKAMIIGCSVMEENEDKRLEYITQSERIGNRITEIKSAIDNREIKKALESQSKLTDSKFNYINQADFGASFNNKIGAGTVGKLFQIIGLAKKTYHRTTPYDIYVPTYAINDIDNKVKNYDIAYKWAYKPCIDFLDKWLIEEGIYEEFYSKTNKDQLKTYINDLYEKKINNVAV